MTNIDTADKVLAVGSKHSLVSGVLSLAGEGEDADDDQDLLPGMVEPNTERILTRPHGVLAVHIKEVKFRTKHFASFFDSGSSIAVYLIIHAFNRIRATAVYKNVEFPSTIAFDDIKHFSVSPNPKHYDEENQIRIELIGYDRPDVHQIIAWRNVHIYDIIKAMYVADVYKLVSKESKTVAEVEIEYCYAYGELGFGASNQLGNNRARATDLISHSLFARAAPPGGRKVNEDTDVMTCIPVGPPSFVQFPERSQLSYKSEYAPISTNAKYSLEPMMLSQRIKRKLADHQEDLEQIKTRKERIKYIRSLVFPDTLRHSFDTDEFMVPGTLRLKEYDGSQRDTFQRVQRPTTAGTQADDFYATNLNELDTVLEQAPGLALPRRRRIPSIAPSLDEYSLHSATSAASSEVQVPSFAQWLCDLLCRPFRNRNQTRVVPVQSVISQQSNLSEGSVMEMKEVDSRKSSRTVYSYYSASLNPMVQDSMDPKYEEMIPEETATHEMVRKRMEEATRMISSADRNEYLRRTSFSEEDDDDNYYPKERKPVPNIF